MGKQITLLEWAGRRYDPSPSIRQLQTWARLGRIQPAPVLVGREYRVDEDAVYVPARRAVRVAPVTVLESEDPVVNDILARGKTSHRRPAGPA